MDTALDKTIYIYIYILHIYIVYITCIYICMYIYDVYIHNIYIWVHINEYVYIYGGRRDIYMYMYV